MRFAPCWSFALLPLLSAAAHAADVRPFEEWWPEAVARLEHGQVAGAVDELRAAREAIQGGLQANLPPAQGALVRYSLAYADWRLAPMSGLARAERKALLEEGVKRAEEGLELDPRNAELHAMLAAVHGLQMGMMPSAGMELGPKAAAAMERALELAPNNPRVVFLHGLSAFHTPPAYGGSVERAEADFRRALALFENEPQERPWPNWGRLDTHAWLGQLLERRGDYGGARGEYQKALASAPEFRWVRDDLLPRLDQKTKKK